MGVTGVKRMHRRGGTSQPGVNKNLEVEKLREFWEEAETKHQKRG